MEEGGYSKSSSERVPRASVPPRGGGAPVASEPRPLGSGAAHRSLAVAARINPARTPHLRGGTLHRTKRAPAKRRSRGWLDYFGFVGLPVILWTFSRIIRKVRLP